MIHIPRLLRRRSAAALLALGASFAAFAQANAPAQRTPRELIDALGLEVRQLLATPRPDRTRADAEREAASHISALIAHAPGHLQLTAPDARGRTPLMLAVSGGYLPVVQALLSDASVQLQINATDDRGVSAWMLANFVPGVSLVACEPGTLTIERAPLLAPYLPRMVDLLSQDGAALGGIVQALARAGAQTPAEDAKRAWLARCPNAEPALREALNNGALIPTLVTHAMGRLAEFNRQLTTERRKVADRPPAEMRFNGSPGDPTRTVTLLRLENMKCPEMPKPNLGKTAIRWRGDMLFRTIVSTRAGVVETVDIDLLPSSDEHTPDVLNFFRAVIVNALVGYKCLGDHQFEREFQFSIH